MSTQTFLRDALPDIHRGLLSNNLRSAASSWEPKGTSTSRGDGVDGQPTITVAGATPGIEAIGGTAFPLEWITPPIDQAVTISGAITVNLWMSETNMSANVGAQIVIERLDSKGAIISTILNSEKGIEVPVTTPTAQNWAPTPTSTSMNKGDRFRIRVAGNDIGTMASGFFFTFHYDGTSAASNGDSYVTFAETFGYMTTDPTASTVYLTDTASDVSAGTVEREMWTSRGAGVQTDVTNTANGPTTGIQTTDTAGGAAAEWYTKQLQAFTLAGPVKVNVRAMESSSLANAGLRVELAVCNADGTGAVVWASACILNISGGASSIGELDNIAQQVGVCYLAGADLAVTNGQRLRLREYVEDDSAESLVTGHTVTTYYAGTSGGASGDTFITLGQTLAEYTASQTIAVGRATETDTARRLAVPSGRVTETDTAQALRRVKRLAIGQPSNPNTAGVVSSRRTRAIGQASDTETAGAVAVRPQKVAVARATDTETAAVLTHRKTLAIGQASTTETSGAIARVKAKAIGQAADTETSQALARLKTKTIAQTVETDTARTLLIVDPILRAIAQASDAETAAVTTHAKRLAIAQAVESDSARTLIVVDPILRAIAQASDTETAGVATPTKRLAIGQATETGTARTLLIVDPILYAIAQASSTETARALTVLKAKAIGQATDTETAGAVTRLVTTQTIAVAQATDTETAVTTTPTKRLTLVQATDTETARALIVVDPILRVPVQATDTETAGTVVPTKRVSIGQASETDTSRTLTIVDPILRAIAQASDTESAQALARLKTVAVGQVVEAESSRALTAIDPILRAIAQSSDTETAQVLSTSKIRALTTAEETDTGRTLIVVDPILLAIAETTDTETAQSLVSSSGREIGRTIQADSSRSLSSVKFLALVGTAESDSATATTGAHRFALATTAEADSSTTLRSSKDRGIGRGLETESSGEVNPPGLIVVAVGTAAELGTARTLAAAKRLAIAGTFDIETADVMGTLHAVVIGEPLDVQAAGALARLKELALGVVAELDTAAGMTSAHVVTITEAIEASESQPVVVVTTTPPIGRTVETSFAASLIALLVGEEPDVQLAVPGPDMSAFEEAQRRLRQALGVDIAFYIPGDVTWPDGTALNPETGRPFDPTVEPTEAASWTGRSVRCSVVHRPIRGSVEDIQENDALALMDAKNVALIMSFGAFPTGATEFEWLNRRYKIVDHLQDALSTSRRELVFGEML